MRNTRLFTFLLSITALFNMYVLHAQNVAINTTGAVADNSAILDIASTNSGLLVPRVALTSVNVPINTPATSLLVWNTSTSGTYPNVGFHYFDGIDWVQMNAGGAPANAWLLTGNGGTNPGTGAGQNFLGTTDVHDLILATNNINRFHIKTTGSLRMFGDLENQGISGVAIACSTNVVSPVPGGAVPAVSLGLPTNIGGTTARSLSQPLSPTNDVANACIIDGTTQSITILDGSGTDNSGVVIMGSVAIRTLNVAVLPNANRFQIWLQRSNDNFVSNVVNVWRTESAVACGLPVSSPYNMSSGNMTVPIIYPDLGLAPGTYTYRLVFQGGNYGGGSGTVNYEALDRSLVILQVKR